MIPKQDRSKPRTPEEVQRRYGKRVNEVEKENQEQSLDLNKLKTKLEQIIRTIDTVNTQIEDLNEEYEGLDLRIDDISELSHSHSNKTVIDGITQENVESFHIHRNKITLDNITDEDIEKWETKYQVGDIYITTLTEDPLDILGYGTWTNISTETVTTYTYYLWLRTN